jgi:hypothetical protein
MENPTIVRPIDNKLVLSSASNVIYGAGIKTFQVNPNPPSDILTQFGNKQTTGAKYITEATAADYAIGFMPYITGTQAALASSSWTAVGSTAGMVQQVRVTGVNPNNEEISEVVVLNGTSTITLANKYKCIIDINLNAGGVVPTGHNITVNSVTAAGGQDLRVVLYPQAKYNPYFMVSSKNGVARKARLRSINNLFNTTTTANIGCHVFANDTVQPATVRGVLTPALRLMDQPVASQTGITFPEEGVIELGMGEMAVWYRETASAAATYISATWVYHNA